MLKGTITKLTTFLCSIFLLLSVVVPFNVSADDNWFNTILLSTSSIFACRDSINDFSISSNKNIRAMTYYGYDEYNSDTNRYDVNFYTVGKEAFQVYTYKTIVNTGNTITETYNSNSSTFSFNGITYYSASGITLGINADGNVNSIIPFRSNQLGSVINWNIGDTIYYTYTEDFAEIPHFHIEADTESQIGIYNNNIVTYTSSVDGELFYLRNGSNYKSIFVIDDPQATVKQKVGNTITNKTVETVNIDGVNFYYVNTNWNSSTVLPDGMDWIVNNTDAYSLHIVLRAARNQGSVIPSLNYGDPADLGYYSRFVNQQQSTVYQAGLTKDIITWNKYVDSNGNSLDSSFYIEIQAQSIKFEAATESDLLNMTINNLILYGNPVSIGRVSVNNGSFETTWNNVVSEFNQDNITIDLMTVLNPLFDQSLQNAWYKQGWYYRVRLCNDEIEYYSDWSIVYQLTSFDVSDQQTVINYYVTNNNNGNDKDVSQVIQNINNVNNTTNNWYVNDAPIQGTDGNNWVETLLEGLFEMVNTIIEAITGLGGSIINSLFDLISSVGVNIIDTFADLWNRLIELIGNINFTDDNPEYDLNPETGEDVLDIIPAFIRMINSSGLGYMIWIPFVVGIVFMIL